MYQITSRRNSRKTRRELNIHQNVFDKGYISTIANSRRDPKSLADLTNMELVQDGIPRPRPSSLPYGTQPTLPVIGRGEYTYNGERWELFVFNDGGVGKVYKRKNGGAFTLIGGSYTSTVWTRFTQSMTKVYIYNGTDKLSYLDLTTGLIQTYTSLTTPSAPTVTMSGATSTNYTYYYKVAANNVVGTSAASNAGSDTTNKIRDQWTLNTDFMTITWSSVVDATSYNVYMGDSAGNEKLLTTTTGLTFIDDGSLTPDPFTLAPQGNSTDGPILKWMYNDTRNSQLFGIDNENKLWYSAAATGDFSPYDGGGYIPIDENGETTLNFVEGFRDGKGNPVITVSGRGAAGRGKMWHVTFDSLTYGDQVIVYGNVYEANGQSAPYAPRAVVKARDSLYYPTGDSFKATGTSQNIVNILTTGSISQVIEPDVMTISLAYLDKAVGVEYADKIFFALPVNSTYNNQIWYLDLARKNLWVLRWTFTDEIKDLWLYEDSTGTTHFCALIGNTISEFTRSVSTEDNGVAFRTRVAYSSLVWDEDGLVMANIRKMYFKFLNPKGDINISVYGLDKDGVTNSIGNENYTQTVSFSAWDTWVYDEHQFDEAVGALESFGKSIDSAKIKTNARMINQLDWEIVTEGKGADYLLSAVNTQGTTNDKRKLGD